MNTGLEEAVFMMKMMEEKLIELMGKDEYAKFSTEIAKATLKHSLEGMTDGDFKTFVLENFDMITK